MKNKFRVRGLCASGVARCALGVVCILIVLSGVSFAQDPVSRLRDETLSYFKPLKGKVTTVNGGVLTADLVAESGVRKGMRLSVFREGMPFLHPVTKEPMGKVEAPVGKAEVRSVTDSGSTAEIVKGSAKEGDILRISEMKVRLLFYQDRGVDWNLAEAYYQLLKGSGRFELIDSALDSADDATVVAEAKKKNAEAVLMLTSRESEKEIFLRQRILWADDSSLLADREVKVDVALVKELRSAQGMAAPLSAAGDVLLFFDLPFSATLMAAGDVNGDGTAELIMGSGRELRVYSVGASLHDLYGLKGSISDDFLWVDTMDMNADGKDEIIVTSIGGRNVDTTGDSTSPIIRDEGRVMSYIYELRGSEFYLLWTGSVFLRVLPSLGLVGQKYDNAEGFQGGVFTMKYDAGDLKTGEQVKLPQGVNLYDFAYMDGPDKGKYLLAYDSAGFLNLFNSEGLKVWQSKEAFTGFRDTFRKASPTLMTDRGEWSIKDRLLLRNRESFVVKRIPLASMVKGLGYKSSQIRSIWWTGLSMEESTLIDDISGSIMDYTLLADKLVVLSKPLFGLKPKNILKGESPRGSMLYVYSLKGR